MLFIQAWLLIKIQDNYNRVFSSLSHLPAVSCHDEIKAKKSCVFSISSWLPVLLMDCSKGTEHKCRERSADLLWSKYLTAKYILCFSDPIKHSFFGGNISLLFLFSSWGYPNISYNYGKGRVELQGLCHMLSLTQRQTLEQRIWAMFLWFWIQMHYWGDAGRPSTDRSF